MPNHCFRWNKWENFQPVPLGSGGRKHLCVGRAHATSDVRNPPVGGEKCKEKEQLVVINPSLSREFP